jgi:hypothetical protein
MDNRPAGYTNDIVWRRYENTGDWSPITMFRARGSAAAPANLQYGDGMGGLMDVGYVNGAFTDLNRIIGRYEGNGTTALSSMSFETSNAERMRIDSAGNVGIGTTTPAQNLHINSTGAGNQTALQIGTGAGSLFLTHNWASLSSNLRHDDGTWRYEAAGPGAIINMSALNGDIFFQNAPAGAAGAVPTLAERMIITTTGNVGIGTTTPDGRLSVVNGISLKNTSNITRGWLGISEPGITSVGSVTNNELVIRGDQGVVLATGGFEYMRLATNGNVGIGTTNPGAGAGMTGGLTINGTGGTMLTLQKAGVNALALNAGDPVAGAWTMYDNANGSWAYSIVSRGGNVGIGLASPSYRLDVNGTVNAASFIPPSDRRLKKNIGPLALDALATLHQLKPVRYEWKKVLDNGMKGEQLGFIAQDVEKVLPHLVVTTNDEVKTKSLKYSEFIPVLTKAIQQLEAKNTALKARLDALDPAHANTSPPAVAGAAAPEPLPQALIVLLSLFVGAGTAYFALRRRLIPPPASGGR